MQIPSRVTGPSAFEGNSKLMANPYQVGLGFVHERTMQSQFLPVRQTQGILHGGCELGPAVRINGVISRMSGIGHRIESDGQGMPGC